MPDALSAVERVKQLKEAYTNRAQLDTNRTARIETMYRLLFGLPQDKKTIDVLLFEADEDTATYLESHVFDVLKTLTWRGKGQINFQQRSEWGGERDSYNLYFFGPTLVSKGQLIDTRTLEKRIRTRIQREGIESKVVFFHELERLFVQPIPWEKCFPINVLLVSAEQYSEYRSHIGEYLKKLKVGDVINIGERSEFVGLVDRPAFNIVGTPSKEELLKDPSKYAADIAFINLMCTQKPLLDELQLPLILSYRAANPYTFVRATVNEHQAHVMTTGEPHPDMTGGQDARLDAQDYRKMEEYCRSVMGIVRELQKTSCYGLRFFHLLRPDTSLLAKWGHAIALPKPRGGENPISRSEIESFYYTYANSLVHHFLSGDDLYLLLSEKAHIQSRPNLSHELKLTSIIEPTSAFQTGAPYLTAIEDNYKEGLWLSPRTRVLIQDTAASFRRFLELVKMQHRGKILIEFNDELCITGTVGAIDKKKRYPEIHNIVIGKPTPHHHAWALYHDWLTTQKEEFAPNFQTPRIRIPIPINNLESFVVEEYIIGPTVCELLDMISTQHAQRAGGEYSELRNVIYDVEMERFLFYINKFRELITSPDGKAEPVDLAAVKQTYIDHFYDVFENRARFTNVKYDDEELAHIKRVLHRYGWDRFITNDAVRRNLAATFRNSIAKTGLVNISLDKFLQLVSDNGKISKTKLRNLLFRIDQGDKYSVPYEDIWEMLDFPESGLRENEKLQRAREVSSQLGGLPEEGSFLFRLYRSVREADLLLATYGWKIYDKRQRHLLSDKEAKTKLEGYKEAIMHYDRIAIETCNKLPAKDSLRRELTNHLDKLRSFKIISYDNTYSV